MGLDRHKFYLLWVNTENVTVGSCGQSKLALWEITTALGLTVISRHPWRRGKASSSMGIDLRAGGRKASSGEPRELSLFQVPSTTGKIQMSWLSHVQPHSAPTEAPLAVRDPGPVSHLHGPGTATGCLWPLPATVEETGCECEEQGMDTSCLRPVL